MSESKKRRLLLKRQLKSRKRRHSTNRPTPKALLSIPFNTCGGLQSFDFTSSRQLFKCIISPHEERAFFDEYWEVKPLIIKRNTGINDTHYYNEYNKLFSFSDLCQLTGSGCIRYGQNINVCRYVSGKRESLNGGINSIISLRELNRLWKKEKATFQIHQPQQYKGILWRLLSSLETYFSCLVGCNIYMTPSGSQGLAPHYDDVEVLILQLEGMKHWRLYPPLTLLPESCSKDLNIEDIGTPSHDFILEAGDVMYFPRGTIHHADTPTGVPHSTHITISTYQKHSAGNLLREFLPLLLEESITQEPLLRKGLPLNHLSLPNGYCNDTCTDNTLSQSINDITQLVLKQFNGGLDSVAEQYSIDFIMSRLPPYYTDLSEIAPRGCTPGINDKVTLCWPDYTYLHGNSNDEWVYVYHSINNDRRSHMMAVNDGLKPNGLKFPKTYLKSLQMIFVRSSVIQVSGLPLSSEDQLNAVMTLWAEGLLTVVHHD